MRRTEMGSFDHFISSCLDLKFFVLSATIFCNAYTKTTRSFAVYVAKQPIQRWTRNAGSKNGTHANARSLKNRHAETHAYFYLKNFRTLGTQKAIFGFFLKMF